jgi:hypothetical protein
MIRKFIRWLELRFPVQIVVTVDEHESLKEKLKEVDYNRDALKVLSERVRKVEDEIKVLNGVNGFVSLPKGSLRLER